MKLFNFWKKRTEDEERIYINGRLKVIDLDIEHQKRAIEERRPLLLKPEIQKNRNKREEIASKYSTANKKIEKLEKERAKLKAKLRMLKE